MALRFRKSFKVLPGLRVNVGKRGITSVSLGTRGARVTMGSRGTTTSLGIPGTGVSVQSHSPASRRPSSSSSAGSVGALAALLWLGAFGSCVVCVCSNRGGSSSQTSKPSPSVPASTSEPRDEGPPPGTAASAPAVVHTFGDGVTCQALGACKLLSTTSSDEGITWHLATANGQNAAHIEILVSPDSSRISVVDISRNPSGRIAALVLEDLQVPNDDRIALDWYVREHIGTTIALKDATPLCAAGVCVAAGSKAGEPAARLRFDPKIVPDAAAMKHATASARQAAKLAERRAAKDREQAEKKPTQRRAPRRTAGEPASPTFSRPSTRTCCKHCTKGIPCGDTCIAANRTCHAGPGCAC